MEIEKIKVKHRNELRRIKLVSFAKGPACRHIECGAVCVLRTDEDLVRAAQLGDNDAFAELCSRHARAVRRKIFSIVRHHEDAEDALQETLLRAYANLRGFQSSSKFSTWITAIGINAALAVLRKKKSRRELDIERRSPEEVAWDIVDEAPDPERCSTQAQIILLSLKKLEALSPKIRKAMTSYYGNESSLQEAADALGISTAAVKSRLLRGRLSLRTSLERKGLSTLPL